MMHNVDFHAVTGMHGGGHATMAAPGEEKAAGNEPAPTAGAAPAGVLG